MASAPYLLWELHLLSPTETLPNRGWQGNKAVWPGAELKGCVQVNPEKAAKQAAAAARKAMRRPSPHKAAIYEGLLQEGTHKDNHWRTAGKCSILIPIRCRLAACL